MKKRQNNSARASALQIAFSITLISISAIMLALAEPSSAPKRSSQPSQAALRQQVSKTKPKPVASLVLNNKAAAQRDLDEQPQVDCIPFGQPGTTCLPVDEVDLPGASTNPAITITKPAVAGVAPIIVSDIDPAVNDHLQAFDGDFVYDSSVVTFSELVDTAGTLISGWVIFAIPNLTNTTSNTKILRIGAYSGTGYLDTTGGNHTLCNLRVIRASNRDWREHIGDLGNVNDAACSVFFHECRRDPYIP